MNVATDSGLTEDDKAVIEYDTDDIEDVAPEASLDDPDGEPARPSKKPMSTPRRAMLVGLALVVALATLIGWFGYRDRQSYQAQSQRSQFLQVARQGALNLTTIDWQHADADVQRILDAATGEFYDDFAKRSQPFIKVLKQTKSITAGTITEAGLESETADSAQALVAVSVKTSHTGEPDPDLREWRMRIFMRKIGDQVKVSNVGFVP